MNVSTTSTGDGRKIGLISGAHVIGQRHRNASFIAWLRDLHFALFAGTTGLKVNGWFALGLIFISLIGLVLWLQTYVKGKAFAVNLKASWKRQLWDWHRLLGIANVRYARAFPRDRNRLTP